VLLAKVQRTVRSYGSSEHITAPAFINLHVRDRGRIADLFIGCGLLALTAPLMLLVVIALKIESHSAVFERQNCIAAGGRRFQMLKFRTRRDPE